LAAYLNGWITYYSRWSQLLAARGYMVLMPNYRGSTGRGVAFSKADHKDLAGKEFDDVLAGIPDELLAENVNYLSHPAYRTLLASERLNQVNIKAKESAYYPSVNGFVNYDMKWQGDKLKDLFYTPSSVAGFTINIPLFAGFGTKAKVQQAKLQLEMLQNGKVDMERGISFQVRSARINYENAQKNLAQREKNLSLAEKIYNTTKIKYKEGVGSSLELSQAEMSLYQSQQNIIDGKFELLKAKIKLKQALGK